MWPSSCTFTSLIITLSYPLHSCLLFFALSVYPVSAFFGFLCLTGLYSCQTLFSFTHILDPLINGSAGSPNHPVIKFKDPFDHYVQLLSYIWCTPGRNREWMYLLLSHTWYRSIHSPSLIVQDVVILLSTGKSQHTSDHLPITSLTTSSHWQRCQLLQLSCNIDMGQWWGRKYVRTVPLMVVSPSSCTIDEGLWFKLWTLWFIWVMSLALLCFLKKDIDLKA